jgi:hypothetical protein
MIVNRRTMIAGSGAAIGAAAATIPASMKARAATLHIHDSRLPSLTPAPSALQRHDIAGEETQLWRASRQLNVARDDVITGETRWSDWVALRGLLAERGLRERATELHKTAMGTIVIWEMG